MLLQLMRNVNAAEDKFAVVSRQFAVKTGSRYCKWECRHCEGAKATAAISSRLPRRSTPRNDSHHSAHRSILPADIDMHGDIEILQKMNSG